MIEEEVEKALRVLHGDCTHMKHDEKRTKLECLLCIAECAVAVTRESLAQEIELNRCTSRWGMCWEEETHCKTIEEIVVSLRGKQ